jgi:acyl-coenzyme A synthetase/AMP-(fatty) acid ligase
VKTAAAFPIRSPIHGDIPAAAVELHVPGDADAAEIVRYARERLGTRAPRKIVVMDALPRNAAGKVVKRLLEESLAERS